MDIKGKVHCFFEQSGTFKNEFIKLGIPAEDYDIQNNFGETDHVIDLFEEIEKGYAGEPSLFDSISKDDLILAFFPCIKFCDLSTLNMRIESIPKYKDNPREAYEIIIKRHSERDFFFALLNKLFCIVECRNLRMVFENPYNGMTYLKSVLRKPDVLDSNRMDRGDFFVKPTGYWFFNCEPTHGFTYQHDKQQKMVWGKDKKMIEKYNARGITFAKGSNIAGICSEERSLISSDYARNWICDFVLGKYKPEISGESLFSKEEMKSWAK